MTDDPTAHVIFELQQDEDGWPPVGSERLWAYDLGGDRYRIDNVPWFVRDLAVDDIVWATAPDEHTHPFFRELLERSEHCTIRIIVFRDGPLAGDVARARDLFDGLGLWIEGAAQRGMLALDVPPTADLRRVVEVLRSGEADGSWEYEEGRITPAWEAATA